MSLERVFGAIGDVSDLIGEQGIEAFERLVNQLPPPNHKPRAYLTVADLERLPPVRWLVDELIPELELTLLYGDPGVGKSFIAVDLCVRIATGQPAHGRATKRGAAIYVALEGQAGPRDRLYAAAAQPGHQDPKTLPLAVIPGSLDLLSGESVSRLIAAIRAAQAGLGSPALIVIDTLSRAMPGANENSADDMSSAIAALTHIMDETGAAVMAVHHAGKTAERGGPAPAGRRPVLAGGPIRSPGTTRTRGWP
jgi:KaiC/GvpD/RAD55 family RecA-like ATPase